jgi:hypothetical protein
MFGGSRCSKAAVENTAGSVHLSFRTKGAYATAKLATGNAVINAVTYAVVDAGGGHKWCGSARGEYCELPRGDAATRRSLGALQPTQLATAIPHSDTPRSFPGVLVFHLFGPGPLPTRIVRADAAARRPSAVRRYQSGS